MLGPLEMKVPPPPCLPGFLLKVAFIVGGHGLDAVLDLDGSILDGGFGAHINLSSILLLCPLCLIVLDFNVLLVHLCPGCHNSGEPDYWESGAADVLDLVLLDVSCSL